MEHVKRGKLKLKAGASLKVASSNKDKKKKRKSKKKESLRSDEHDDGDGGEREEEAIAMNDMTPAQRRHEEHRKKRVSEQANVRYACDDMSMLAVF